MYIKCKLILLAAIVTNFRVLEGLGEILVTVKSLEEIILTHSDILRPKQVCFDTGRKHTLSRTIPYLNTLSRTIQYLNTLRRTIPYLNTLQSAANQVRVLRHPSRQPIRIEC